MNLSVGIIGLPNVGKSTLFNALIKKQIALAANYPFATIEPNIGIIEVPDDRLKALADLIKKTEKIEPTFKITYATIKIVDIAGLVKGASEGAGLGNKFLAHIREVDAIAHVIRDFTDPNVIKTGENPQTDRETINTELILADLETMTKLINNAEIELKKQNTDKTLVQVKINALQRIKETLNAGKHASETQLSEEEKSVLGKLPLITSKPMIYVYNIDEDKAASQPAKNNEINISAKIEAELAELEEQEANEYLASLGLKESGLHRLAKKAYEMLELQSFLTAGPKEVRAWTIKKGTKAPQAAAVIHTDFEKKFIKAECIHWQKLIEAGSYAQAKEQGLVRIEGKDYIIREGDVIEFKVNT